MVVTLPLVLLLLDYWPLCRFKTARPDRVTKDDAGPVIEDYRSIFLVDVEKELWLMLGAMWGMFAAAHRYAARHGESLPEGR